MRALCLTLLFATLVSACATQPPRAERAPAAAADTADAPSGGQILLSEPKYEVTAWEPLPVALDDFRSMLDGLVNEFQTKVGPFPGRIKIFVAPEGCLLTGYNFVKKRFEFCQLKDVINQGFDSPDVIRHEAFHAMLCSLRPELCTHAAMKDINMTAMHEGLADFFAFGMAPDRCFGENFYHKMPCLRRYVVPLCYSLTPINPHPMGNAIASMLISAGARLEHLQPFLEQGDYSLAALFGALGLPVTPCFDANADVAPHFIIEINGRPVSPFDRKWVTAQNPANITITVNSAMEQLYPNWTMRWVRAEDGKASQILKFTNTDSHGFVVSPSAAKGFELELLQILNGRDVIGEYTLGLGAKNF